jgi:hypothetical protein
MSPAQTFSSPPHRGQLVRDYTLRKLDGSEFMLSDFRNKLNLVLIVVPDPNEAVAQLLRHLAEKSAEVRENETRVIVVLRPEQLEQVQVPPELIAATDQTGHCFAELGAESANAIYFLDKFREVFHVYQLAAGQSLPSADDILGWIRFVAMQCPECHPPEWPADAL